MSREDFRSIVAEFDALKRRLAIEGSYDAPDLDAEPAGPAGFAEAHGGRVEKSDFAVEEGRLDEVEARALDYEIRDIAELEEKLEFILARVAELTDERDEFFRYADALRESVIGLIRAREGEAQK